MSEAQMAKYIFHPGFSTAAQGHRRFRSRCRHGCGQDQYRADRRYGRDPLRAGQGHGLHHQDPADAGHRGRPDPSPLRISASPFRRFRCWNWCASRTVRITRSNASTGPRSCVCATGFCRSCQSARCSVSTGRKPILAMRVSSVVSQVGRQRFGILVDGVFHTRGKSWSSRWRPSCAISPMFSGKHHPRRTARSC